MVSTSLRTRARPLWLQRVITWTERIARSRGSEWALFWIAFVESCILPIPPSTMLVPLSLAEPRKTCRYALAVTAASVLGGAVGWLFGYALYDWAAKPLIAFYGFEADMANFQSLYDVYGFWIVIACGIIPVPYKVVAIASGMMHMNLGLFALGTLIGRGARYAVMAWALRHYGRKAANLIERHFGLTAVLILILVLAAYAAWRFFG